MSEAFAHRYKLLERIAIGGTAEVFRALFLAGDGGERPVVIKRILPQFARDERFRRLFHEEACVAVTMSHPSIVRVLDHGDLGPTCYIALELVEGRDLGSLLAVGAAAGRSPTPRLAAYVAAQVADALQFIHDQKSSEGTPLQIIHRDVSPQNILVAYRGDVKLTDFGIAKSAIRREQTVDGTLRGKLDYMSPEQAVAGKVDHRADIFALGCVLYQMLEGKPPFSGEHELDTLERVRQGRIGKPPEELDAPAPLRAVLARALARAPEDRYQHAGEMAADLHAFLASQTPVTPEELGRWVSELAAVPDPSATSRVDDAVRQLLGGDDDGHTAPVPLTAVFASSGEAAPGGRSRQRPAAARSGRPLQLVLLAVAGLGLCGWLLWALGPRPPAGTDAGAAPVDRRASGDAGEPADAAPADAGVTPGSGTGSGSGAGTGTGASSTGETLLVRSAPPGATVLVDGRSLGRTPLRVPRRPEPFTLELQRPGFRPWRHRALPGEAEVRATLTPAASTGGQATLTLNTLPWSRVRIDGKAAGNTPLLKHSLRAGAHRIDLLAPDGAVRKTLRVTLPAGEHRSFTFDFTR